MTISHMLRAAASDAAATERALELALAECDKLKEKVKELEQERSEYFRPRVDGDVKINVWRDKARHTTHFLTQIGSAQVTTCVDSDVFMQGDRGYHMVYIARNAASAMSDMIARKIAPMLYQAMKESGI